MALTKAAASQPAQEPPPARWAGGARFGVVLLAAAALLSVAAWGVVALYGRLAPLHPVVAVSIGSALILCPLAALLAFAVAKPRDAARIFAFGPGGDSVDDSEGGPLVIQILAATALLALAAGWAAVRPGDDRALLASVGMGGGAAIGWLVVAAAVIFPARDGARRLFSTLFQVALLSLFLFAGDAAAAPFFPAYLLVVFGQGFRGGGKMLALSAAASATGFAIVAATTPVWRANWPISIGLLIALGILPAYVSILLRRSAAARAEAQAVADAKGRLFAIAGQELRTPLNAMAGLAELMRGTEMSGEQTTMLDTIKSSAGALLGVVDDLLDFSKIDAGEMVSPPAGFDLPALLSDIVAMMAPEATRKGLAIGYRVDPLLPDNVEGHPIELRRILIGLVSHALRVTSRGEIRLGAELSAANERALSVRFEVRDTGNGLSQQALREIADAFTGEDRARRAAGDHGLGLMMSRELASLIGGTVAASNEPGIGSRFTLDAPLVRIAQRLPHRLNGANVGIYGPDPALAEIFGRLPILDTMGVVFTMLGALPDAAQATPEEHRLLIFDGRLDPVGALATAARLGGRATRQAPATLVVAHPGVIAHLQEMAAATVDTILAWTENEEILVRVVGRLIGRAKGAAQVARAAPVPEEPTPSDELAAAARRFQVLVAEDNQTNRMVLERILTRAGHEVLVAHDGSEALSALEVGGVDAAILDINSAQLSGYHVAKLYRQMEGPGEHLPLIGLTGDATSETDRLCREAGMDAALVKPVPPEEMLALLDRLVETVSPQRPIPPASMVVTPITAHPRFGRDSAIVDQQALEALIRLGNEGFLRDVIEAFGTDADQILETLEYAQADRDIRSFKDQIQAMRSSAVNVGAIRLCQTLRDLNDIALDNLSGNQGSAAIAKIRGELDTLKIELGRYISQRRPAE